MLRKIRLTLAILFFALITLLFLDFTGSVHALFGWMARIQFLPALLAVNVGVVLFWVLLTLLFGRVYCSVICPLGVMQDVVAWFSKRKKKNRYSYSPAKSWLRYGVLALFIVALIAGIGSVVALLAPYSAYGRIAQNLFAPIWACGNNILAYLAERMNSYAFYETEVWVRSLPTFIVAGATLLILVVLAWRSGRTYCNTICPVGTVLGLLSRFSLFRPVIDLNKCNVNSVHVDVKPPASMPTPTRSIIAVALCVWIVSMCVGRERLATSIGLNAVKRHQRRLMKQQLLKRPTMLIRYRQRYRHQHRRQLEPPLRLVHLLFMNLAQRPCLRRVTL